MKKHITHLIFTLTVIAITIVTLSLKKPLKELRPKNVIFMIGDGMGLAQISGAMSFYTGQNAFERFKIIGLSKTSSDDNYVTDSGAGATVFSIGKKTFNGAIGVGADSLAYPNLFELVKKKDIATGVVVTSSVTHATPAAFYAHVSSRRGEEDIADFLLQGNCDVTIGGGMKFFNNRKDKRNLFDELHKKRFVAGFDTTNHYTYQTSMPVVYTLAWNGMKTIQQGRGDYLEKASLNAIQLLSGNKNGFMLMIEGSQIDWGGHDTDFNYMKAELIDFNEVINKVLDYAAKDGNTLVIVTADHETGGLSLLENHADKLKFRSNYATNSHSGIMVPVFAFGPGAEEFSGIYENTEIHFKLKRLLDIK